MNPETELSALNARTLSAGDLAPDFSLPSDQGEVVTLSDLRGRRVIVYFYPTAMTPGCTQQACDFSESLGTLGGAGFEVLGISPDSPETLVEFRHRDHLAITLLSDPDMTAIKAYGAFGEKTSLGGSVLGLIRSTFVVDENGVLEVAQYDVTPAGHVAALRRDLGLAAS